MWLNHCCWPQWPHLAPSGPSQVTVTDVNDNPPFLVQPREVWVVENRPPKQVARVILGDPDDWGQGHGPPFTIHIDPRAPPYVHDNIKFTHSQGQLLSYDVGRCWVVLLWYVRREGRKLSWSCMKQTVNYQRSLFGKNARLVSTRPGAEFESPRSSRLQLEDKLTGRFGEQSPLTYNSLSYTSL